MKKMAYKNFKFINNFLIDLKVSKNINFLWCLGSILGLIFRIQIISGIIISIHYSNDCFSSFNSIVNIHYNITNGWVVHNLHINGASLLFILIYSHILRNIFFTFYQITTWVVGCLIIMVTIIVAFIGYVLPWGQISFWGATVITRLISSIPYIGLNLVEWIWGGYSVDAPTLNRLFSLHFILPFILLALIILHLINLHKKGSRNPVGIRINSSKIQFYPYFIYRDLLGILILIIIILLIIFFPILFSDSDNFIKCNSMVTPVHIQPEWYFLFTYSILRRVPNKLGGVVLMGLALMFLFLFPFFLKTWQSSQFKIRKKLTFFIIIYIIFSLTWEGIKIAAYPYYNLRKLSATVYFVGLTIYIS